MTSEVEKAVEDKFDVFKELHEWQEIVGSVVIGKGLSYQCEIEGVIEDTVKAAIEFERKRILEEAEKRQEYAQWGHEDDPDTGEVLPLSDLKEICGVKE